MIYFTKVIRGGAIIGASARGKRGEGPLRATCAADDGKQCYVFLNKARHKLLQRAIHAQHRPWAVLLG